MSSQMGDILTGVVIGYLLGWQRHEVAKWLSGKLKEVGDWWTRRSY